MKVEHKMNEVSQSMKFLLFVLLCLLCGHLQYNIFTFTKQAFYFSLVLIAESYPLSITASIEILTPVIDISDDDDDDDLNETEDHCRYSVTRRSGLFFNRNCLSLHVFIHMNKKNNNDIRSFVSRKSMFKKQEKHSIWACSYFAKDAHI